MVESELRRIRREATRHSGGKRESEKGRRGKRAAWEATRKTREQNSNREGVIENKGMVLRKEVIWYREEKGSTIEE